MSTRNVILKQLKTDLEDKISTSRDYNTDPTEVRRGSYINEDFSIKPAISFRCYDDKKENELGGDGLRWLYIYICGYADTDGLENTDDIHDLADDVEDFLYSTDWTYTDDTEVGDMIVIEGGIQDPHSMFQLELRIKYSYTI